MRTPSPHQSTARVYDVSVKTSGAKNSGVPQNVLVRSRKPIPESQTEDTFILVCELCQDKKNIRSENKHCTNTGQTPKQVLPSLQSPKSAIFT